MLKDVKSPRNSVPDQTVVYQSEIMTIMDSDYHVLSSSEPLKQSPTQSGITSGIGRNCTILPGVSIGDNAVVAAGSVVTRSVSPSTLVGGVPARVIQSLAIEEGWIRRLGPSPQNQQ